MSMAKWLCLTPAGAGIRGRDGVLTVAAGPVCGTGCKLLAEANGAAALCSVVRGLDYMIVWEYSFLAVDEPAGGLCAPDSRSQPTPPHASSPDDGVPGCRLVSAWLMPQ